MKYSNILNLCIFLFIAFSCDNNNHENPVITTLPVSNVTTHSALAGADISNPESELIIEKGICWGLFETPNLSDLNYNYSTNEDLLDVFKIKIENLRANTTYYYRAYYTTENDTIYGIQLEFVTPDYIIFNPDITYGTVVDVDGNEYKTVTIGNQTWMAENLKTTCFRNGDKIQNLSNENYWSGLNDGSETPSYCLYRDDDSYNEVYGLYYNWSVVTDERNIAPEGWRVPNKEDWDQLINFSAYSLREETSAHWSYNSEKSTNSTGFSAIAGGKRHGDFAGVGNYAHFFSTSTNENNFPISVYIGREISYLNQWENSFRGYNIRCIKE